MKVKLKYCVIICFIKVSAWHFNVLYVQMLLGAQQHISFPSVSSGCFNDIVLCPSDSFAAELLQRKELGERQGAWASEAGEWDGGWWGEEGFWRGERRRGERWHGVRPTTRHPALRSALTKNIINTLRNPLVSVSWQRFQLSLSNSPAEGLMDVWCLYVNRVYNWTVEHVINDVLWA